MIVSINTGENNIRKIRNHINTFLRINRFLVLGFAFVFMAVNNEKLKNHISDLYKKPKGMAVSSIITIVFHD